MNNLPLELHNVENYGFRIRKRARNLLKVSVKLVKLIYVTTFFEIYSLQKNSKVAKS